MWKKIVTLVLACTSLSVMAQTPTNLALENCHIDGIKSKVRCGTLSVPEDYQQPQGTKIDINVVVLPAIDKNTEKEPLMFLAGGPGQAATELAAHLRRVFYEVRKQHDIILVDQRGTGQSSPLLCDENIFEAENIYGMSAESFTVDQVKQCLAEMQQNMSQYNSENAIRDFDAVRAALGYEKINVYGGSYGTRAALVYLRLFPESLNSVILDSVGPIEVPIGPFGQSSARSFELLLENCQAQQACSSAFPNLKEEYQTVYNKLQQAPVSVTIPHPRLGTPTTLLIDNDKFINTLRLQLYSMETRTIVPLVVHQAFLGNYLPFAGLLASQDQKESKGGMYFGLTLNIVCNEDFPLVNDFAWQQDADNSFGANTSHKIWRKACPVWPTYQPSAEFYQPVTANVPTLILSGNLDPVTPPANGDKSDATLPNSRHIVVKNAAHIVAGNDCAVGIIREFIENKDLESLDQSCLQELPDETFMTSLNGNT